MAAPDHPRRHCVVWLPPAQLDADRLPAALEADAPLTGGERSMHELAVALAAAGHDVEMRGRVATAEVRRLGAAAGATPVLPTTGREIAADDVLFVLEGMVDLTVWARLVLCPARVIVMALAPLGLFGWPFSGTTWSLPDPHTVPLEQLSRPEHFQTLDRLGFELWTHMPLLAAQAHEAGVACSCIGNGSPTGFPAVPSAARQHDVAIIADNRWAPVARQVVTGLGPEVDAVELRGSNADILRGLGRARVLVHPMRVEGHSRLGCEARAMGAIPVVLQSNRYAVGLDEAGGAVCVADAEAMPAAIAALLADPDRETALRARGMAAARRQVDWAAYVARVDAALGAERADPSRSARGALGAAVTRRSTELRERLHITTERLSAVTASGAAGGAAGGPGTVGRGSIDRAVVDHGTLRVEGWAAFDLGPAATVEVRVGPQPGVTGVAETGFGRPDVREATGWAWGDGAGFRYLTRHWDALEGPVDVGVVATALDGTRLELPAVSVVLPPSSSSPTDARPALIAPEGNVEAASCVDGMVRVTGWAVFPTGPVAHVDATLGDHSLGRARVALTRRDVRDVVAVPWGIAAGFEIEHPWPAAASGPLPVRIVATALDGTQLTLVGPVVAAEADASSGQNQRALAPAGEAPGGRRLPRAPQHLQRVLLVTHDLERGGAQLCLRDLALGLREVSDAALSVLSLGGGPLRSDFASWGLPVHVSSPVPGDDAVAYAGRVAELSAWVATGDFDAAFVSSLVSLPAADALHAAGVPTVWAIHESFSRATLGRGLGFRDAAVLDRLPAALRDTSIGLFTADATRSLYDWCLPGERARTLYYGMDLDAIERSRAELSRAAARRTLGIAEDAQLVLCVGSIDPRKAQLALAEAFTAIADAHPAATLAYLGRRAGPYADGLDDYVHDGAPPGRIRVEPATDDVAPWYAAADLLVCASDLESLPRTLVEAMVWEIPVLATDIFGIPELVEHGRTGWLCPPRDVGALAAALDQALRRTDEERSAVSGAARAIAVERHALLPYARTCAGLLAAAARGQAPASTASV